MVRYEEVVVRSRGPTRGAVAIEFLSRAVLVPENHLDSHLIFMSGVGNVHTIYSTTAGAMSYMRKSEWSRCRLNDLSCKCTVHRWKALELSFLLVYGTYTLRTIAKLSP